MDSTVFRQRKKSKKYLFLTCSLLVLAMGTIGYFYSRYQYFLETPVSPGETKNISFIIKSGENLGDISNKLSEKELIIDKKTFEWYNRLNHTDRNIISGRFTLNQGMTIREIVEKITNKSNSQLVLTVPEGTTISQIDQKLVDLELIEPGEFITATKNFEDYDRYPLLDKEKNKKLPYPLEGFLFPDTYFLNAGNFHSEDLIGLMVKNFQEKIITIENVTLKENREKLFDTITMASIVEKEVNTNKDRPIVAGILWKRLNEHWQLGADATLLYLKQNRTINTQDLKESSPYNTRKFTGLPPGPIGNPGLKSIQAALEPETTPYYFYLHRADNGETVYSTTNEEHNINKQKYL